jgi:hypothetical protein
MFGLGTFAFATAGTLSCHNGVPGRATACHSEWRVLSYRR